MQHTFLPQLTLICHPAPPEPLVLVVDSICGQHLQNHSLIGVVLLSASDFLLLSVLFAQHHVKLIVPFIFLITIYS